MFNIKRSDFACLDMFGCKYHRHEVGSRKSIRKELVPCRYIYLLILKNDSPSCPQFKRCSPKSQPKTLSLRMPCCLRLRRDGRDNMKLRKSDISFPCLRNTGFIGATATDLKGRHHNRTLSSPTRNTTFFLFL